MFAIVLAIILSTLSTWYVIIFYANIITKNQIETNNNILSLKEETEKLKNNEKDI